MGYNGRYQTASILEGERGVPSVNTPNGYGGKRRAVGFFLLLAALLTMSLIYVSYLKSHKVTQQDRQKSENITHTIPERTFTLPVQNQKDTQNIVQQNTPHSTIDDDILSVIDKSGAALMASKEKQMDHASAGQDMHQNQAGASTTLSTLLTTTSTPLQSANLLKNRDYLLVKGSFIDCVLQTRLDSTVPGMTSCVVTRNIYGDTGKVLLVERGSTVSGEYESNMRQGQARIFVVWSRIKTPNGVVINLDSPGTDSLGGSGVPGYVDTHFGQRFGSAILLSMIQDASLAAASALANNNNTNITVNNTSTASEALAVEALKSTIHIPPTLYKNQGDRVGIYVARDLDFKTVYDLRPE